MPNLSFNFKISKKKTSPKKQTNFKSCFSQFRNLKFKNKYKLDLIMCAILFTVVVAAAAAAWTSTRPTNSVHSLCSVIN